MGKKFDHGVAAVSCGFDTTTLSNLTIAAGKVLSIQIENVIPTEPELVFDWQYVFTADDVALYNARKLDYILDGLQTNASNNSAAMPYLYFAPTDYRVVMWFVDILDLGFVTHDLRFTYKLDATTIVTAGAGRYNIDIGADFVSSVPEDNTALGIITGGIIGFAIGKM